MIPKLANNEHFSPESKIWIYPASRRLSDAEAQAVENQLAAFCKNWTAHNQALLAQAEVFENRLLLLMVDESQAGASGCSIDKSVHFIETLGARLGVDFFDRMQFGWLDGEQVVFGNRNELSAGVADGKIAPETPMLNTMAQSRRDLAEKWLLPFGSSWHKRLV